MTTRKLYYEDAYIRQFAAQVVEKGAETDGTPYVVLDQTAFYPTGGGQPCDLGQICGIAVVDVEEMEDGAIRHRLAATLADEGEVHAEIDWTRRFDHMQQHDGQHILSAAFEQLYDADTLAFHLGDSVTVDIDLPDLTQEIVERVEELANRIVFENRPILQRFVTPEELAQIPMRGTLKVHDNVRIVTIDGFDNNGCGGTHPARTGEVGPIKILTWERTKGHVRLTFTCGWRTLKAMTEKQLVLRALTRQMTSSEAELPDKITRLLNERKELDKAMADARGKLLGVEAEELLANAETHQSVRVVAAAFPDRAMAEMQKLAQQILERDASAVALLCAGGDKVQLVCARGTEVLLAANEVLKSTLPLFNGKGGGSPAIAQGGGVADVTPEAVVEHARQVVEGLLAQQVV
ncbi:MAG: DHHA1 domain-containing protein [Tumebacillaceae bacterium]